MSKKNITRNAIVATFKKLVHEKSFYKITVTNLCDETGISRRCFYDYFKDIYDVVNWIFADEFLSTYTEKKEMYFFDDFFFNFCDYCHKNADYYSRILTIKGQNSFSSYFIESVTPLVIHDVKRGIPDDTLAPIFTQSICDAILLSIPNWLKDENRISTRAYVEQTLKLYSSASTNFTEYVNHSIYFPKDM